MAEWDTAFDISLLENPNIIVHCPSEELAEEFMDLLAEHGVKWNGIGETPDRCRTNWGGNQEDTCYWIEDGLLSYGGRRYVQEYTNEFHDHIKCTFYGAEPDFEISEAGFEAIILGSKGGGSDGMG